jgi:imidazolonepropionase-like amidohydrolase
VQSVDGVDGARKAVREQVMYGADWIKSSKRMAGYIRR